MTKNTAVTWNQHSAAASSYNQPQKDSNGSVAGQIGAQLRYHVDKDMQYKRETQQFKHFITSDPDARFPAENDRYALYVHLACPWAHRTLLALHMKGLQDFIQVIVLDSMDPLKGWYFSGEIAGPAQDPLYGAKYLRQIYERADPSYNARVTVPMLWDKINETIVSTESSDIVHMFYTAFDHLLPEHDREEVKGIAGLYPPHLRASIDQFNDWVFKILSNGVYRVGFASNQEDYGKHINCLFAALDRLEDHLEERGTPYFFGAHVTDADVRLFPTIVRFDAAYFTLFRCNLRMIRYDYPRLHDWLRRLYWAESGTFRDTTFFDIVKRSYARTMKSSIIPAGPVPHILPPDDVLQRKGYRNSGG